MAMDNDIVVEVAMDNTMNEDDKCAKNSSPLFQGIWAMVDGDISIGGEITIIKETYTNQIKTQEKEGGGEEAKVKANA